MRQLPRRTFADGNATSDAAKTAEKAANSNLPVLLGLAALGAGVYWYVKPVRDVASKIDSAIKVTEDAAKVAKDQAKMAGEAIADGVDPGTALGLAQQYFPAVAAVITTSGLGGVYSSLKDGEIQDALEQLEKAGNEDIKNITKKVKSRLNDAGDKVENMDWRALASDLSKEYGGKHQDTIDVSSGTVCILKLVADKTQTLIGKVPTSKDFDQMINNFKKESESQLKELEKRANKVYVEVEKARKDTKTEGDAWVQGIKKGAPEELDALIDSFRDACKAIGVAPETMESYIKSKTEEGIKDTAEYAAYVQDKFNSAVRWVPLEQDDIVAKVSTLSPSLGKLVNELMTEGSDKMKAGKKALEKGKKEAEGAVDDVKNKAGKAVDDAKDKAGKAVDKGKDVVKEGADKVEKAAKDVKSKM